MKKIVLFPLFLSIIFALSERDIPNFKKYYKPEELRNMDMFSSRSQWSWYRYKQSEHFFIFWEQGFGTNPNSQTVKTSLRVDVDDLLMKAEKFYQTNIVNTKFAEVGLGRSYLDKYKMEIYLFYSEDWLATGSGYDDVIGALWVSPSTCQPVGSVIGHEIGHSFQYQVYCDKILNGDTEPYEFHSGFRYGYEGSNGGNGFWEQTAQWQSFQDYPEEMFTCWEFDYDWIPNYHRHFEHELIRYGSYWLHYYWADKYGVETIGNIWRNSVYPEDGISTYTRIYNNGNYLKTREELFDYAIKMATYDLDSVRGYSGNIMDRYSTTFYETNGYYQISYANCPGATGFNVIPLKIPSRGGSISIEFVGLEPGSSLALNDPGQYKIGESFAGKVRRYNSVNKGNTGWRYGFVALLNDESRQYSDFFSEPRATVVFNVPKNTYRLFMVVQGSPETYIFSAWDDDERTDAQFPYKIKLTGTSLI